MFMGEILRGTDIISWTSNYKSRPSALKLEIPSQILIQNPLPKLLLDQVWKEKINYQKVIYENISNMSHFFVRCLYLFVQDQFPNVASLKSSKIKQKNILTLIYLSPPQTCLDPISVFPRKHSQMLQQRYLASFLLSLHSGLYKSDHFILIAWSLTVISITSCALSWAFLT